MVYFNKFIIASLTAPDSSLKCKFVLMSVIIDLAVISFNTVTTVMNIVVLPFKNQYKKMLAKFTNISVT